MDAWESGHASDETSLGKGSPRLQARQESLLRQEVAARQDAAVAKEALQTCASRKAQILEKTLSGSFNVRLQDGSVYFSVQNASRYKWKAGMWVTIERTGKDWQIVGISTTYGGEE